MWWWWCHVHCSLWVTQTVNCVTLETQWDKKRRKVINVLAVYAVPARQSFPYIIMCVLFKQYVKSLFWPMNTDWMLWHTLESFDIWWYLVFGRGTGWEGTPRPSVMITREFVRVVSSPRKVRSVFWCQANGEKDCSLSDTASHGLVNVPVEWWLSFWI